MITIRHISSQDTIPVRQPVLRPGKPVETCIFNGDDMPSTLHLGIYDKGILAGVLSIFEVSNPVFKDKKQYQLRGMAILEEHQKKGLGEKLVQYAEKLILDRQADIIWFNARESATGFYSKMGYEILGDAFAVGDIGIHYVMFKKMR